MEKLAKQIIGRHIGRYIKPSRWQWPDNWALKLLSLMFAIFLWYFVVGEDRVDIKVFIPVEIVNLPHDLVISNEFKKQLDVTIRGPRVLTRGIEQQHITRSVDLSKATPGKFVFSNPPDSIPFPRGITVLRVQPKNVTLLLDQLIQKDMPIKAVIQGKPSDEVELVNVILDPATLSITGPQELLARESFLSTLPVDVSNIHSSTEKEVALDLKPEIAELIGEPVITVKLVVKEITTERSITGIPIEFSHGAAGTTSRLTPSSVNIRAEIPISMINNKIALKPLFTAKINSEGLPPGRHLLNVEVTPPKQVRILEISPKSVTLRVGRLRTRPKKQTPP